MSESPPPNTGPFTEYQYFEPLKEGAHTLADRDEQNARFQAGKVTNPAFAYPKLDRSEFEKRHEDFTRALAAEPDAAARSLIQARQSGVEIATASLDLQEAPTHTDRWYAGRRIRSSSESRYGEVKPELFWPVLVEKRRI